MKELEEVLLAKGLSGRAGVLGGLAKTKVVEEVLWKLTS